MLTDELVLIVPGTPAPKGSLKCVGGRGGRHQLVEDNARTKPWRDTLATWARKRWPTDQRADPGQALGAEVTLTVPRPAGHYGTGRNARTLRPSAPAHPITRTSGDVDKLLRLVLDALQDAAVLADDAAVVEVTARKAYERPDTVIPLDGDVLGYPGAVVRLWPLDKAES